MSRTLLSDDSDFAAVKVVNTTAYPFRMKKGCFAGEATFAMGAEDGCVSNAAADPVGLTQPSRSSAPSGHVRSCRAPLGEGSSHLASLFDALPADLSPVDRAATGDFIHKYAHVFSKSEFDLGRTSLIPHKIDTGQSRLCIGTHVCMTSILTSRSNLCCSTTL